ncbi:hypothetical protein [Mycolicibacterium mageritense]|uniref:Uncharacterized protein n=1 Tax=Mycolicibacterium mageritense TaxID=53462 RepID=A0AAI8TMM6_MYCME|nr:hypothetical protein [Mycolicibacterium mageritense]BDY27543.1 hypothetical protein hbim_01467 [Mycolicibacterium mageritense]
MTRPKPPLYVLNPGWVYAHGTADAATVVRSALVGWTSPMMDEVARFLVEHDDLEIVFAKEEENDLLIHGEGTLTFLASPEIARRIKSGESTVADEMADLSWKSLGSTDFFKWVQNMRAQGPE